MSIFDTFRRWGDNPEVERLEREQEESSAATADERENERETDDESVVGGGEELDREFIPEDLPVIETERAVESEMGGENKKEQTEEAMDVAWEAFAQEAREEYDQLQQETEQHEQERQAAKAALQAEFQKHLGELQQNYVNARLRREQFDTFMGLPGLMHRGGKEQAQEAMDISWEAYQTTVEQWVAEADGTVETYERFALADEMLARAETEIKAREWFGKEQWEKVKETMDGWRDKSVATWLEKRGIRVPKNLAAQVVLRGLNVRTAASMGLAVGGSAVATVSLPFGATLLTARAGMLASGFYDAVWSGVVRGKLESVSSDKREEIEQAIDADRFTEDGFGILHDIERMMARMESSAVLAGRDIWENQDYRWLREKYDAMMRQDIDRQQQEGWDGAVIANELALSLRDLKEQRHAHRVVLRQGRAIVRLGSVMGGAWLSKVMEVYTASEGAQAAAEAGAQGAGTAGTLEGAAAMAGDTGEQILAVPDAEEVDVSGIPGSLERAGEGAVDVVDAPPTTEAPVDVETTLDVFEQTVEAPSAEEVPVNVEMIPDTLEQVVDAPPSQEVTVDMSATPTLVDAAAREAATQQLATWDAIFEQHPEMTAVVQEGGSLWEAAKALVKDGTITQEQFAEAWSSPDSTFTLIEGTTVHISEMGLSHAGDMIEYVPASDEMGAHFVLRDFVDNGFVMGNNEALLEVLQEAGRETPQWLEQALGLHQPDVVVDTTVGGATDVAVESSLWEAMGATESVEEALEQLPESVTVVDTETFVKEFQEQSLAGQEEMLQELSRRVSILDMVLGWFGLEETGESLVHDIREELTTLGQSAEGLDVYAENTQAFTAFVGKKLGLSAEAYTAVEELSVGQMVVGGSTLVDVMAEHTAVTPENIEPLQQLLKSFHPFGYTEWHQPLDVFLKGLVVDGTVQVPTTLAIAA